MKTNIQPHVGAMAYTVLAGTLFVGRIIDHLDDDHWKLLAFNVHPEDADKEDDELDRVGFIRSNLIVRTNDLNVHCASYEAVPAKLAHYTATSVVVTAFDEELAHVNILGHERGYKFAVDAACTIRDRFNKDWRHKIEREMIRAYYDESSSSGEASGE